LKVIRILINAGHGPGKAYNRGALYFNEGDNNYYYSLVLKKELEKYEGIQVDLVRKNINDNPTLAQRAAMGEGYDLYLSIHSNAATPDVRGTEVWDSVERPNRVLAKAICDVTAELFNHRNRGVKYREGQPGFNWYGELRFNKAKSAMIVENGFHTNHDDCLFFKNNHKQLAVVQARAIASFYRLKKKAVKEDKPHWAQEHYDNLVKKGIVIHETRFDDVITRGEVFALMDRIVK
jgi:N-acetylmuramoyl-L-alanine amidase